MRRYREQYSEFSETKKRSRFAVPIIKKRNHSIFGFSDLMIHQAGTQSGGHDLQTFDRQATKLAGVTLLGASH